MQTVLQKAAAGNRKAMLKLYEATKQRVFYVAKLLLQNDAMAESATIWVYRFGWGEMKSLEMETEAEFEKLMIQRVVGYCKKRTLQKNAKAFHVPSNRNFNINITSPIKDTGVNVEESVLAQFSDLQRYIFVLHTVAKYENSEIEKVVNLKKPLLEMAIEAEKKNIDVILESMEINGLADHKGIVLQVIDTANSITVPQRVDDEVNKVIGYIVEPIEKRQKKQMLLIIIAIVIVCIVLLGVGILFSDKKGDLGEDTGVTESIGETGGDTESAELSEVPLTNISHYANIVVKDYGTITVALDDETAPETVANFVDLAQRGFYDGLTFHRIIDGFMMQGGDPEGDGTGGSDETITGEFSENGFENNLSHTRGAISMARSEDYDSASSQFFIVHEDSTYLDGEYAVFGYVTEGMDVVDAICASAEPTDSNGTIPEEEQPVIEAITIYYAE